MTKNIRASKSLKVFGVVLPIILIILFLLFPVISVLISSVYDGTKFSFEFLGTIFSDTLYYYIFGFTFSQALLSTIITLLVGIPIGYVFGKYEFRGRKILLAIFTVPFILPTVLVGMGFVSLFGESGFLGSKFLSLILAHTFYNVPLVIHYFSAYYRTFDQNMIDAAKTLGSKGFHRLFRVFLPLFLPPILSASVLTFIFCFLSYGVVYIIGAGSFKTTEIQIYSDYFTGERSVAAALALIQLILILLVVVGYLIIMRYQSRREKVGKTEVFPREKLQIKKSLKKPGNIILLIIFILGLALELAPMISIIITSFLDPNTNQFSNNFLTLFNNDFESITHIKIGRAITNTLLFALGSATIAGSLAIVTVAIIGIKKRRKSTISLEILSYLPITISSITLSIGIREIFYRFSFFVNYPWIFILISHGLIGYPFVIRALLNGINNLDQDLIDSAQTLGAKWWFKFRKIYFPLLFRSFIAGFVFALGISLGEFTITNFFSTDNFGLTTLTVVLFRLRSDRHFGPASAVGVLLLVVSYFTFIVLELFESREKTSSKI
ncbi:MAG: iron ABC transporter permease [Asgard group archaeon]|nr:iron ABC transporter permease [Asgard group archaeon]